MDAIKDSPADEKIHITDQTNDVVDIICRAIFGKCTTKVIEQDEPIEKVIEQYRVVILSSVSKKICTTAYKEHLAANGDLYLLNHLDFELDGIENEDIFRFTIFNLELFRRTSTRAKSKFIISQPIKSLNINEFNEKLNLSLIEKSPLLFPYIYQTIAFENRASLINIFDILEKQDSDSVNSLLEFFIIIIFYSNSHSSFCKTLIDYFKEINYLENKHKFYIFLLLNKIYGKMDPPTIQKINFNYMPAFSYCLMEDHKGEYLEVLQKFIDTHPPLTVNGSVILIIIYSKIFENERYFEEFAEMVQKPSSKNEIYYHDTLLKVEILLKEKRFLDLSYLQRKEGLEQYIMYLLDNHTPEEPSSFYDLLIKQSTAEKT